MIPLRKDGFKKTLPIVFISILAATIIMISCSIDNFFIADSPNSLVLHNDLLYKIFGQLRYDLGAICYLKADQYFHKGTRHTEDHKDCFKQIADFDLSKERSISNNKRTFDFFAALEESIHFRHVEHLQENENAEIIPWFELTTIINPNFERAYLDGSYWLSIKMNAPDKAISFLKKGLRHNPTSWKILSQIGNIYFINKKDYSKAFTYFKHAYTLLNKQQNHFFERKQILSFLSTSAQRLDMQQENIFYENKLSELEDKNQNFKK